MRVIKVGGRAQNAPNLPSVIRDAWNASRGELCVVHGGGDEVSSLQRAMGREAVFVNGRRVTLRSDIDLLRMVLSGVVNKRLVNLLVRSGVGAVGLSGEDAALIEAEPINAHALGFAGIPTKVNSDLLKGILNAGYLPVISPVAFSSDGSECEALNVNGDDAAAAIAVGLAASELVFVADVEGVRDSTGAVITTLGLESLQDLLDSRVANAGMAAKLESARKALTSGVVSVRICDLRGVGDANLGTTLVQSAGIAT